MRVILIIADDRLGRFPTKINKENFAMYGPPIKYSGWKCLYLLASPHSINLEKPIVAQAYGEKSEEPRDLIRIFVTAILENMVGHACSIRWKDAELERRGFPFMWDMWKEYYVSALFTDLNLDTDLYNPILQPGVGKSGKIQLNPGKYHKSLGSHIRY